MTPSRAQAHPSSQEAVLRFLIQSCSELNLGEQGSRLIELNREMHRWRARVAIVGERCSGKTTLMNALLGQRVFESGPLPVEFPVLRVRSGPKKRIEVKFAHGVREAMRFDTHRQFVDLCLAVGANLLDALECVVYLPECPALQRLELVEMRLPVNPTAYWDAALFTISARAPVCESALEFQRNAADRPLLIVVTCGSDIAGLPDQIRSQVGGEFSITEADSELALRAIEAADRKVLERSGIPRLEGELRRVVNTAIFAPRIAAATTEVRKTCAMVEQAAAFAEQAMHSSAADYQHHFQGASADLDGLARAMREFETTLARHDSEIHSLIARLTNGVQNQMDTAAGERIENAELPPARLANAGSRDLLAQEIVSTAYQAAFRVHDRLQDYAIKELKHALSLALAEIDRIRSSAEIRVQEITYFLGPELAASLGLSDLNLAQSCDSLPSSLDAWLAQKLADRAKLLSAEPVYKSQVLTAFRQIFVGGIKDSIARHWETIGSAEATLRNLLATTVRQFFRAPADDIHAKMRRSREALDHCFSSRRLALLGWPAAQETRDALAAIQRETQERARQAAEQFANLSFREKEP